MKANQYTCEDVQLDYWAIIQVVSMVGLKDIAVGSIGGKTNRQPAEFGGQRLKEETSNSAQHRAAPHSAEAAPFGSRAWLALGSNDPCLHSTLLSLILIGHSVTHHNIGLVSITAQIALSPDSLAKIQLSSLCSLYTHRACEHTVKS